MKYNSRHGGPFDRGAADSYYRRSRRPHFYEGRTLLSRKIEEKDMMPDEIAAYNAGFSANEKERDFKDWDFHPTFENDGPYEEEEE